MSRDLEHHRALVALAGWIWIRIRRGDGTFRRADLDGVENLGRFWANGETSRRALIRALEDLADFGIEARWDSADEVYRIADTLLSDAEQQALANLALDVAYRDLDVATARRLPGALMEANGDVVLLDTSPWLGPLAEAIESRTLVALDYGGRVRTVQPVTLGLARGAWYLVAHEGEARKVYKLDRIAAVEGTDAEWDDARHDVDAAGQLLDGMHDPMLWGDGATVEAVVAVDETAALRASRLLKTPLPGDVTDGRVVFRRPVRDLDNLIDAVLGLGARAEILAPPEARARIVDRLRAAAS